MGCSEDLGEWLFDLAADVRADAPWSHEYIVLERVAVSASAAPDLDEVLVDFGGEG
ncbi:MAG: hypothetical protein IT379_39535 [Deltaproteobacteria bacterium]|nr:hypothetical protein [Deltaproteobacteria bacterium]